MYTFFLLLVELALSTPFDKFGWQLASVGHERQLRIREETIQSFFVTRQLKLFEPTFFFFFFSLGDKAM